MKGVPLLHKYTLIHSMKGVLLLHKHKLIHSMKGVLLLHKHTFAHSMKGVPLLHKLHIDTLYVRFSRIFQTGLAVDCYTNTT